jgi:hypothetical protein
VDDFIKLFVILMVVACVVVGIGLDIWRSWGGSEPARDYRRGLRIMLSGCEYQMREHDREMRRKYNSSIALPRVAMRATIVRRTPKMLVLNFEKRRNVYLEERLLHNLVVINDEASFEIDRKYLISNRLL